MGMAAACSSVSACGLGATRYDGVVTKAASAEGAIAMTASPGLNASTSAPTAVTRPAHSAPSGTIPGGTPGRFQRLQDVAEVQAGRDDLDLHLPGRRRRPFAQRWGQAVQDSRLGGQDPEIAVPLGIEGTAVLKNREVDGLRVPRLQVRRVALTAAQRDLVTARTQDLNEQASGVVATLPGIKVDDRGV